MANQSAQSARPAPSWADFVYDAFYSGAIGGSVVALLFLLFDTLEGQPLFTPSLMGSVLFQGIPATDVVGVELGMVAAYSAVHFASFTLLGAGVAFAVREVELHARNPFGVLLALFAVVEWAFLVATAVLMPGILEVLGAFKVAVANLFAAGAIALFIVSQHRPELWERIRHARQAA